MNLSTGQYWDVSWSPIRGCSHDSPGCANCWAERMAGRFSGRGRPFDRIASPLGMWTGRVELIESELVKPLHWRKPRVIALNWMGDLFHESLPDEAIDRVFAVMALCQQHKFLVLTKRSGHMMRHFTCWPERQERVDDAIHSMQKKGRCVDWPLPNVALGVSVEDQQRADERIPDLLATPAAMRFVSVEPMLGVVDLTDVTADTPETRGPTQWDVLDDTGEEAPARLDWVVCGGESGPGARPMHPDWARSLRDQCQAAGTPFLFKQWGEWAPDCLCATSKAHATVDRPQPGLPGCMFRCGKKAAGRTLDGRTWDEQPEGWR